MAHLWSFALPRKRPPKSKKISRSWFGVFIARCPWRKLHGHSCFQRPFRRELCLDVHTQFSPALTVPPPQNPRGSAQNLGRVDLRLDPNIPSESAELLPDTTPSKKGPLARSHDQNESPCGSPASIHLARPFRVSCDSRSYFRLRCTLRCSLQNSGTFLLKNRPLQAEFLRKNQKSWPGLCS